MQAHNTDSDNPLLNMPDFLNMENLNDPIDSEFKETIVGPWYNIKKILINNTNGPQTINGSQKKNIILIFYQADQYVLYYFIKQGDRLSFQQKRIVQKDVNNPLFKDNKETTFFGLTFPTVYVVHKTLSTFSKACKLG